MHHYYVLLHRSQEGRLHLAAVEEYTQRNLAACAMLEFQCLLDRRLRLVTVPAEHGTAAALARALRHAGQEALEALLAMAG